MTISIRTGKTTERAPAERDCPAFSIRSNPATPRSVSEPSDKRPLLVAYAMGTRGDVNPLIGMCGELLRRGYRVKLMSNAYFERDVRAAGIDFISVSPEESHVNTYGTDALWNSRNGRARHAHTLEYHMPASLRAFAQLRVLKETHPRLWVLALGIHNGATMACERFDIPLIQVSLTPQWVFDADTVLFNELRFSNARLGRMRIRLKRLQNARRAVAPHQPVGMLRRCASLPRLPFWRLTSSQARLHLVLLPRWYLAVAGSCPRGVVPTGFPLHDPPDPCSRKVVDAFVEGRPKPLVFTPGTGVANVREFFFHAIDASRALSRPCVLLSPHWRQASDLMGEDTLGCDYAELGHILPRSAALVHHGGIGTCAQAIRAGVPQLIRPLQFDQFENAHRIWKLGLGAFLFRENFNGTSCAEHLRRLLGKAPQMPGLRYLSEDVQRSNSITESCDAIERALTDSGPPARHAPLGF